MSNVSLCLTHATWQSFAPDASGASGGLDGATVERTVEELLELPIRTLFLDGFERGCAAAVASIVARTARGGADVVLVASGDERLERGLLEAVGAAGVTAISVPVHGADATTHDEHRAKSGSSSLACATLDAVRAMGIRTAMHTDLCRANAAQLDILGATAAAWDVTRWLVHAEVIAHATMTCEEIERATEHLATLATGAPHEVAAYHAPFFTRMVGKGSVSPCKTLDERNGICITARGAVIPDPAIPIVLGQAGEHALPWLFDSHPLLRALRDPDAVEGKCGLCEYRARCGGSRARALMHAGNLFASDPACSYQGEGRPRSSEPTRGRPEVA